MEGIFRKNRILCIGMNVQGLLSFPSILMISATDLIQLLQIPVKTAYFCGVQRVQSISIPLCSTFREGLKIKLSLILCGFLGFLPYPRVTKNNPKIPLFSVQICTKVCTKSDCHRKKGQITFAMLRMDSFLLWSGEKRSGLF